MAGPPGSYFNDSATTETELRLMAAAANIGDNNTCNQGYKTPAAMGTSTGEDRPNRSKHRDSTHRAQAVPVPRR